MRVVLHDPPLAVLLLAILLDLPLRRIRPGLSVQHESPGWASEKLARFIEWRDGLGRRAS